MSTKHGSLSVQAAKRLRGGELILKGYDNDEVADIVEVTPSIVRKWRKKLKENSDDLCCLVRKKGSGIWDRLSSHLSAQKYFERVCPGWFLFEYLPSYSPELNPVEQCWNQMKNVSMANFVPFCMDDLVAKTLEAAQVINNDPKLLAAFFHYAKLAL
jgi:transposase